MADKCCLSLLGLIVLCTPLTGYTQYPSFTADTVDFATLIPDNSSAAELKTSPTTAAMSTQDSANTISEDNTIGLIVRVILITVEIAVFAAPTVILLQIVCASKVGRKDSHRLKEIVTPTKPE